MIDVEAKRMEARALRGVSYDRRTDRFTAEIYVGGVRRWLGSFHTAEDASSAYLQAVVERPAIERRPSSFNQVYVAFREEHGGVDQDPPVGAEMVYDGQTYTVRDHAYRSTAGGTFKYVVWESECLTCGDEYTTMTAFSPDFAKGITRNCERHVTRGRGPRARRSKIEGPAGRSEPMREAPKQLSIEEKSLPHLEALAAVRERWPITEVATVVCEELYGNSDASWVPGFTARLRRWAAGDLDAPCIFTLDGDTVVFE